MIAYTIQASGYSEWQQTYVVAGELVETAKDATSGNALPYIAGVLAARLLSVVADPLHIMYEKVNKFLHKGPRWNVAKLPSYWVDKILLNPPTGDEAHYQEAEWLLDALIDGLRTPAVSINTLASNAGAEIPPGLRSVLWLSYFRKTSFFLSIAINTKSLPSEDCGFVISLYLR